MADKESTAWQLWWDARVAAIEGVLGKCEDVVGHAVVPLNLGADIGGAADIIYFRNHIPGVVAVTSDLIGLDEQVRNKLGNYELMVCHRDDSEWGADLISRLACYTLETELNPGETMDIEPATPKDSTITAFLFFDYARFKVRRRPAGLLLCVGITKDELKACRKGHRDEVESALKSAEVYPYTDLFRKSVLSRKVG